MTPTAEFDVFFCREVVAALAAAGLVAVWQDDPERRIEVRPFVWRKRAPA